MAITASDARRRLFPLIAQVNDDQAPVEILSKAGSAFLVSADQWTSLQETLYLLQGANGRRLLESIDQAKEGRTEPHDLIR